MMDIAAPPTYDVYKDSGEGWIEDVPAHWETRKLKHLFQEKKHKANLDLNCGSISFGEVVEKDDERVPLATKASYQEVSKGEFLVNPLNLNYDLKSLRIGLSDIDVVVSAGYLVLQAKDEMDKRYFKYLLHRYDVAYMKLLGSGVRQTISFNHIANSILVAPPLSEQRAIAAFLDDKCAKIDGAVKIKEDQIALLRERRQIIIQDAVTRGLNPAAPMKDSGIDKIGQIPAHWEVKRVKHLCKRITKGTTPSTEGRGFADAGVRYIKAENIVDGEVRESPAFFIDAATDLALARSRLEAYDILFVIAGATIGKTAVLQEHQVPSNTNQAVALLRPKRQLVEPYSLHAWLGTEFAKKVTAITSVQSAQPNISMENLGNIPFILPSLNEQREILGYINSWTNKINDGIAIKERQIAALKEYKTSLINAAVTGKIKVM